MNSTADEGKKDIGNGEIDSYFIICRIGMDISSNIDVVF